MPVKQSVNLLYPLDEFYAQLELPLPSVTRIEGRELPQPYRSLLFHASDMTPTLEAACGQSIHLHVLKRSVDDGVLTRCSLLVLEDDATAVELGAIKIYLERFPSEARRLIIEGNQPLGTILHTQAIEHESHPAAFFRVTADAMIGGPLHLPGPSVLYGRRNVLVTPSQETLAEVVEILPPAEMETTNGRS